MAELTIDMTYGNALFQAAKDIGKEKIIKEEAEEVEKIFEAEPEFYALFVNPTIAAGDKKEVLRKVFEGRLSTELLNFMFVLEDKGRTRHFARIMRAYEKLMNEEEGFSEGVIYSVKPLEKKQIEKFQDETGKLMKENIRLENFTDPNLIGGVKILVNGKMIDASLRKRLEDMKSSLD